MGSLSRTVRKALCGALIAASAAAQAQSPAAPPLKLLVPYPAGGAVDFMARHLGPPLRQSMARDLVIENLPGAAGAIALQKLLHEPADGNTLALATDSDAVLVPLTNPELKYRSGQFRLLGLVLRVPMVLVASPRLEGKELGQLLTLPNGGKPWSVGSYGIGSNSHLCASDFSQRTGMPLLHVPYKGVAPLLQELLGGHLDLAFLPLSGSVFDLVVAEKLRPLAIASAQRHPRLPKLPTVDQAAGTQGFEQSTWGGLLVPLATPEPVVQRLHAALQTSLRDPGLREALEASGGAVGKATTLAEAQQFLQAETVRLERLVQLLRQADHGSLR